MIDLTTNDAFDQYAYQHGWVYDNGGSFQGEYWDWYGGADIHIVLLRQPPTRVALVRTDELRLEGIWEGRIATSADFDEMMKVFTLHRN